MTEVAVNSLAEGVARQWPGWFGTDAPRMEWVLQSTARLEAQTSVILYGIEADSGEPLLVAKVNRHRRFSPVTRNEYLRMSEARALLEGEEPGTIARSFGLVDIAGDVHLISSFADADLSWESGTPSWRDEMAKRLAGWLAALHRRSERAITERRAPQPVTSVYTELFHPPNRVQARLDEAAELIMEEHGSSSSESLVHGDFWPGNWRFHDGVFTIVDWEHSHWSPSPVVDEFLFPLAQLVAIRRGDFVDAAPNPGSFSEAYRRQRGLPARGHEEAMLAAIWTAADLATRTHRRWGVVEDWSLDWNALLDNLSTWR